jgi:hypothetical protein
LLVVCCSFFNRPETKSDPSKPSVIKRTTNNNQPTTKKQDMEFVSEKVIDAVIDELETFDDDQYEVQMEAFAEAQPVLFAWLFSEHFELLNEDEKGYLQYLSLIAWRSIMRVNSEVEAVSEEQIGEAEEANYAVLEASKSQKFRDRLNDFFEGSPQEDLLAFAEEAVLEDEDDPEALVSKEAREPIFVAVKTLVDVLTAE